MPTAVEKHLSSRRPSRLAPAFALLLLAAPIAACEGPDEASGASRAPAATSPGAEGAPLATADLALDYAPSEVGTDALIAGAQEAVRREPTSIEAHIGLATLFLRKKRETGDVAFAHYADDALRVARALGDDARAELLHAMLLQDQHRFVEARDAARRIIGVQPDLSTAHLVHGDALLELGEYGTAVEAYQRALDLRPDLRSYDRGAHLGWLHGDPEGAIELLELAIDAGSARDPESMAFCFVDLGTIYLRAGDTRRALAAADRARALVPDYLPALSLTGQAHSMAGRNVEAIAILTEVVTRKPGAEELLALAELERATGDLVAADRHLAQGLRMGASEPRPVATYLARHAEDASTALRLAERELEERRNIEAHDAHALALLRAGQGEEALAAIDRALALGTPDARLHLHRALVLAVSGDARGAAEALALARTINPQVDPLLVAEVQERAGLPIGSSEPGRGA